MRYRALALSITSLTMLGAVACATSYNVRTMAAPKTALTEFHTFHLLPNPRRADGRVVSGAYDPMVNNSITNRALRSTVASTFESRGYVDTEWMPDFVVAVYASAREKLDITQWQYGYPYWPRWWWAGVPQQTVTHYDEGTVIVDVINPDTRDLLWRGSSTARLGDDPAENTKELQRAAIAVVEKFPRAKPVAVAARR